jgi:hypothetical protein
MKILAKFGCHGISDFVGKSWNVKSLQMMTDDDGYKVMAWNFTQESILKITDINQDTTLQIKSISPEYICCSWIYIQYIHTKGSNSKATEYDSKIW